MPIAPSASKSLFWRGCVLVSLLALSSSLVSAAVPSGSAVAVVHNVPWSPGDTQREGACELSIFLKVAQLKQSHQAVGLVGVGNHNGRLSSQAEEALAHVALRGIPVAKVAPQGGSVAHTDDALFVDAGTLPEATACQILESCIERYGPLPAAANPSQPTEAELQAIRRQLDRYQAAFANAMGATVADRS